MTFFVTKHLKNFFFYFRINDKNIPQGKIGLALLKRNETSQINYKMILYRTKTNILATVNLLSDKKVYLKYNYFQFEDDSKTFWSLFFEKESNRDKILEEIRNNCIVEYSGDNSMAVTENVTSKPDLEPKEGMNVGDAGEGDPNKNTKADLLTRMAKMGQAIIPKVETIPITTTEVSESSDSEPKSPPPVTKPLPPRKHHYHHTKQSVIDPSSNDAASKNLVPYTNVPNAPSSNIMIMPTASDHSMNVLLADNRTQNTEIRMNLMKLDSKIDRVLDRFDAAVHSSNNNNRMDREDEILLLEEKMLVLKKENRNLRLEIAKKQTDDGLVDKVRKMESTVSELESKIHENEKSYREKVDELEALNKTLDSTLVKFHSTEESFKRLKEETTESRKISDELNAQMTKEIADFKMQLEEKEAELQKQIPLPEIPKADKSVESVVKEVINNLYHTLCDHFDGRDHFAQDEIIKIIGKVIKTETNSVLKNI